MRNFKKSVALLVGVVFSFVNLSVSSESSPVKVKSKKNVNSVSSNTSSCCSTDKTGGGCGISCSECIDSYMTNGSAGICSATCIKNCNRKKAKKDVCALFAIKKLARDANYDVGNSEC